MRVTARATLALLGVLALAACSSTAAPVDDATLEPAEIPLTATSEVIETIQFALGGTEPLTLDACVPLGERTEPLAAIVVIHGGSWAHGDAANPEMRDVCERLADQGFAAFSINYRLAPASVFPAQLNDVQAAVRWLRADEQVERFGIDPDRIGLLGASAGAHLAALAGASGSGDLTVDARVAAVVELSAPIDLRVAIPTTAEYTGDFAQAELDFLGCTAFEGCATAAAATPLTLLDPSDPPFFVAHSVSEFIPIAEAEALVKELGRQGIDTTYVPVAGTAHAMQLVDGAMMARIVEFFDEKLNY